MPKINDFTGGWFIGNFSPTLFNTTEFEVAYKEYHKGQKEPRHFHKIATEYTLIITGEVIMNKHKYIEGDIVVIHPGESTDFNALTDVKTMVIKHPSVPNDKFLTND